MLNALAFFFFVSLFHSIDLEQPISKLQSQFSALPVRTAYEYLGFLYLLALAWGFASGFASDRFAPRVLAYRLRLTPISPATNVFIDALNLLVGGKENRRLRGNSNQQMAWLRIQRDGKLILGCLRKSSDHFDVEEPIEIFLSPGYIFEGGAIIENPRQSSETAYMRGLYLRLRPEDVAKILVAPASWSPVRLPVQSAPTGPTRRSWL